MLVHILELQSQGGRLYHSLAFVGKFVDGLSLVAEPEGHHEVTIRRLQHGGVGGMDA